MKVGVSTTPWGSSSRPKRADERGSIASTENDTGPRHRGKIPHGQAQTPPSQHQQTAISGNFAPGPAFDPGAGEDLSNNFPLALLGLLGKFPHCLNQPQNNTNS